MDLPNEQSIQLTGKLLDAVWMHGENISSPKVVSAIASSVGLNGAACVSQALEDMALKKALREQTDNAIAAGVFGVPTVGFNGELFWGSESDSMNHLDAAIQGKDPVDYEVFERWKSIKAGAIRKRSHEV